MLTKYLGRILARAVEKIVRDVERVARDKLEFNLRHMYRAMMREVVSFAFLLMSFGLLLISILFFLIDYIHINRTLSFLAVGVMMLLVGIIMRMR